MNDDDDATDGILICDEGTYQGKLILEYVNELNSLRIYEFSDNEMKCYRTAFLDFDDIICPQCNQQFEDYFIHGSPAVHSDECNHPVSTLMILFKENAKKCKKWVWGDVVYTIEYAFLLLFDELNIRKQPKFKEFKKLILKKEGVIFKEQNGIEAYWQNADYFEGKL